MPQNKTTNNAKPPKPDKTAKNNAKPPKPDKTATNNAKPPKPDKTAKNNAKPPKPDKTATNNTKPPKPDKTAKNNAKPPKPDRNAGKNQTNADRNAAKAHTNSVRNENKARHNFNKQRRNDYRSARGAYHNGRFNDRYSEAHFGRSHAVAFSTPGLWAGTPYASPFWWGGMQWGFGPGIFWPGAWGMCDGCYIEYLDGGGFVLANPAFPDTTLPLVANADAQPVDEPDQTDQQ